MELHDEAVRFGPRPEHIRRQLQNGFDARGIPIQNDAAGKGCPGDRKAAGNHQVVVIGILRDCPSRPT